eukprot:Lankesteria_metandrocarpae@DN1393_c0_g1_i1.p1
MWNATLRFFLAAVLRWQTMDAPSATQHVISTWKAQLAKLKHGSTSLLTGRRYCYSVFILAGFCNALFQTILTQGVTVPFIETVWQTESFATVESLALGVSPLIRTRPNSPTSRFVSDVTETALWQVNSTPLTTRKRLISPDAAIKRN